MKWARSSSFKPKSSENYKKNMLDITEQKKSMDWHSGVAPNITKISNYCCMICKKKRNEYRN